MYLPCLADSVVVGFTSEQDPNTLFLPSSLNSTSGTLKASQKEGGDLRFSQISVCHKTDLFNVFSNRVLLFCSHL